MVAWLGLGWLKSQGNKIVKEHLLISERKEIRTRKITQIVYKSLLSINTTMKGEDIRAEKKISHNL